MPKSLHNNQNGASHLVLLIVTVLVIVGGIGVYILTGSRKNQNDKTTSSQQPVTPFKMMTATNATDIKSMINASRAGNYDVKCRYTDDSGNASTIYVTKDKMRVDTTINKKAGHMIWLSDKAYIWADGDTKGSILPVTKDTDSSKQTDKFADNVDKYKMSCQNATHIDVTLFKVPTNISFTEFSTQSGSSSTNN